MKRTPLALLCAIATAGIAVACGSSENRTSLREGALPFAGNDAGSLNTGDGGPIKNSGCEPNLTGTLRDFHDSHGDFEKGQGTDKGIVEATLGADFKPVYAANAGPTTSGKANFDQWYRNTPGVNEAMPFTLTLTKNPDGTSTFDSPSFFPLDGKGFGNEGRDHNFHFTFELHTEFTYNGAEIFTFTGDDDLFAFINNKLAVDLGGVHGSQTGTVNLDEQAALLGITKGATYGMSVFNAERHTTESHFRIDTSIAFTNCEAIIR